MIRPSLTVVGLHVGGDLHRRIDLDQMGPVRIALTVEDPPPDAKLFPANEVHSPKENDAWCPVLGTLLASDRQPAARAALLHWKG